MAHAPDYSFLACLRSYRVCKNFYPNDTAGKNSVDTFAEAVWLPRGTILMTLVLKRGDFVLSRVSLYFQNLQQRN